MDSLIDKTEKRRLKILTSFEREALKEGFKTIAGVDEAGRGPLAGPVVAAACVIPDGIFLKGVNDSKILSPLNRQKLFEQIQRDQRIVFAIGIINSIEIDLINIYQATLKAMRIAVNELSCQPDLLLIDGFPLPSFSIPSKGIIKGDAKSQSIAAASIIAKQVRDQLMCDYHEEWPHYNFQKHKGYGTPEHLKALEKHGPCPIHRRSFEPIKSYSA